MRTLLLSLFVSLAVHAHGQQLDGFERVFIPFKNANITGIGGSRFSTVGTSIHRAAYTYWPHCDFSSTTPVFGRLEAIGGIGVPLICEGGTRGRLFFVEDGAADQISFGYTIVSSSAEETAATHRVSIPVARERDFKRSRFHVVVPYATGRVTLRVYEMNGRTEAAVRVSARVSILSWAGMGRDTVVTLTGREGTDPSYPSFAEVPLNLGCFVTSPRICSEWDAAIEITPLVDGEYWAVISRTDDRTQQITLYWPQ